MTGSVEDRLRASFKLFDKDQNGELSREELIDIVALVDFHKKVYEMLSHGNIPSTAMKLNVREATKKDAVKIVDALFSKADTDHSNSISLDEFVTAFAGDSKAQETINLFSNMQSK